MKKVLITFLLISGTCFASTPSNIVALEIEFNPLTPRAQKTQLHQVHSLTALSEHSKDVDLVVNNDLKISYSADEMEQMCNSYQASPIVKSCKLHSDLRQCNIALKAQGIAVSSLVPNLNSILGRLEKGVDLEDVVKNDHGDKCKRQKVKYTVISQTGNCIKYRVGKRFNPKQCLFLPIPAKLQKKFIDTVTVGHMQELSYNTGGMDEYDNVPGIMSLRLHSNSKALKNDPWRYWRKIQYGSKGGKFAERKNSEELDNLYKWETEGHGGEKYAGRSTASFSADAIKIISDGKDPITVETVEYCTQPDKASNYGGHIFVPNMNMGDPATGKGTSWGDKREYYGIYPNSLALGSRGNGYKKPTLPSGWKHSGSKVTIPVPAGKKVKSIEVAIGDQKNDVENKNSDGGWGSKGGAKASYGVQRADGSVVWFKRRQNVPPQGFFKAEAPDGFEAKSGDRIIIQSDGWDETMLMGVRYGLDG